ncbi:MAG: AMP-binding protein [Rubrivivax sp.]|nr:AMP-binding protein [Rubrivivax sp.]
MRRHATAAPDCTAVVFRGERVSHGALEALANRIAAVWRALGVRRGNHVATLISNRPEALAVVWAAWRCGAYVTPMSTALTTSELRYLIEDCDARVVLVDAAFAALAAPLPAQVSTKPTWLSLPEVPGVNPGTDEHALGIEGFAPIEPLLAAASPLPAAGETPGALMLYTSGTTGAPKGVKRPLPPPDFRGTPPFASDLLNLFELGGPQVRYLSTAPLYHAAALRFALAVTAGGGTVFVLPKFDAAEALDTLERDGITISQWVPAMFQRLLDLPEPRRARYWAPAHRCAIHAAAPCPPPLKRRMIDWWGPILLEYYAGSEGIGLTLIDSHEWLQRPGSVGRARRGRLHIVGPSLGEGDGGEAADLPAGETGLVCFSGLTPFAYHKAPEKTAARTLSGGRQTLGDIGHVDSEGYLYLTDRADDMLISGGVNVYPQEIEAAISEVPGVAECAVVGVPDARFGERPVAAVVARSGLPPVEVAALTERIRSHCEAVLGRIKRPDRIVLVAELPRLPTGKLLRRRLREMLVPTDPAVG